MSFAQEQQSAKKIAKHTLLGALENLTKTNPSDTWVSIPRSSDLKQGWRNITYTEASHSVNGFAIWISENLSFETSDQSISYIGLNDTRYIAVVLAAMQLGRKIMLPSPRNSIEGQANLFDLTNCGTLLYSESVDIGSIRKSIPGIRYIQVPTFDELVEQGQAAEPFVSIFNAEEDQSYLIMHTSGSTGLPKPIYLTNGMLSAFADYRNVPAPEGRTNMHTHIMFGGKPLFTMMPLFHMVAFTMCTKTFFDPGPLILPPTGRPMNADLIIEVLNQIETHAGMFAPSLLEEMSRSPEGLDAISKVEVVVWGGAPIANDAGERIRERTIIGPLIGTTEGGLFPTLMTEDPKDWHYYEWSQDCGFEMVDDGDGLYECVLKRNPDRRFQPTFHTFPDLTEYHTKDLYARHPTKQDLWDYRGRKDDVIVLNNGEKVNPVSFEKAVEDHPLLRGVVVVGQGRFQTGVIIEPVWENFGKDFDPATLIDEVWPAMEKANEGLPDHGRVWKSKIVVAKPDKPFTRAGKGSVVRRQTVKSYESEIEAMYSNEGFDEQLGKLDQNADIATVKLFVRQVVSLMSPSFREDTSDDADLFSIGIDSLQVLGISNILSHALNDKDNTIGPRDVYANPTIAALSNRVMKPQGNSEATDKSNRKDVIKGMIERYTQDLPERPFQGLDAQPGSYIVILTGSTGGLGNYILQELISSSSILHIYCLNRSNDAKERQLQSFKSRAFSTDMSKVTFLNTDLSKPHFNLPDSTYTTLLQTTTHIIHNAWTVDFNKSLPSFESPHVIGTRHIVDFSLASTHHAQITFTSSIATVQAWTTLNPTTPKVPEETFQDPAVTVPQGYSESKYIAEQILRIAATRSGVSATVIRSGQLAGPTDPKGLWNRNEWLPSIVVTSKSLRLIPRTLGNLDTVDWVPLDTAARVLLDLVTARTSDSDPFAVYHLINPRVTTWSEALVPVLAAHFAGAEVVEFDEWVRSLGEVDTADREKVQMMPGVKLLDFYRGLSVGGGLPRFATERAEAGSVTLRELGAVDGELMRTWLRQWGL